jgi:hypothetical protein
MKTRENIGIKNKWLIEIISALLMTLFIYAAMAKLTHYHVFVFQVGESPFKLLARSAPWIAWLIPAVELLVALSLPFNKMRLPALYASAALMVVFTIYIAAMLISGLPLPCACGGIIGGLQWIGHLVFNSCFLTIAFVGIWLQRKQEAHVSRRSSPAYTAGPV